MNMRVNFLRKLELSLILLFLLSCGPSYYPMGLLVPPPPVIYKNEKNFNVGMSFMEGKGHNFSDRFSGFHIYGGLSRKGRLTKTYSAFQLYGGEYKTPYEKYKGTYNFYGLRGYMEGNFITHIKRLSVSFGGYVGFTKDFGSYATKLLRDRNVITYMFNLGFLGDLGFTDRRKNEIVNLRLYWGIPFSVSFNLKILRGLYISGGFPYNYISLGYVLSK
jgi:hypothetical protein